MKEIETAILANYPVLYVISSEETRFVKALERTCIKNNRKLWVYSISEGLRKKSLSKPYNHKIVNPDDQAIRNFQDPIALLEYLKTIGEEQGMFLLLDFHEILKDTVIKRLIKDITQRFKENRNNIIILASVLEVPKSIENEICVLHFDLPTLADLMSALNVILKILKRKNFTIDLNQDQMEKIAFSGQGMTMDQYEGCIAKAVVKSNCKIDKNIINEIIEGKKQIIRKTGLEYFDTTEAIEHIGGLSHLKKWLQKRKHAFTKKAKLYGLPIPKGILLLGVQGCGKSLTAKVCASLWKFPLLRLDTGTLFSSQVGSSEERTRQALRMAEAVSPCVLWIDELEKALAGVGSSSESDAGTAARVFATIATWLQEKTSPVFVIATANTVTSLPPELIRKGRFDEIFFLDLPGFEEREWIFRIHISKRNRNPGNFDIPLLAESSRDYSGAEIEQAIISGLYDAFDENRPLETRDILENLKNQVPLSTTMAEHVQALRQWALTRARWASEQNIDDQKTKWRNSNVRRL